jgi:hypothetical protein
MSRELLKNRQDSLGRRIMKFGQALIVVLTAVLCLAPNAKAGTFYLKDGSQIEYLRYWQKDGTIYLLINRDTQVEFASEEVDLKRTAMEDSKKHPSRKHNDHKLRSPKPFAEPKVTSQPTIATTPVVGTQAASAGPQQELNAIYSKLYAATRKGNYREQTKYLTGRQLAAVERMEKAPPEQRKLITKLLKTMPPEYVVTGCTMASDGKSAILKTVRKTPHETYDVNGKKVGKSDFKSTPGEVTFVKDSSGWKVEFVQEH